MSYQRIIRLIVFISGAVVMGVEIMASRLLAPYYGDTVYVWGSLIAVIMTALAIGYRRGGKKADRDQSFHYLSNHVLIAGVFVILIPLSTPSVLEVVKLVGLPLIYEPLLASAILLSIPTTYMGMISPYALRLSAKNFLELGGLSGELSSLNTIGGIVGTFITVFFLVPNFGTREIITGMGLVLIAVSLVDKGRTYLSAVSLLLIFLLVPSNLYLGSLMVFVSGEHVFTTETPYSSLNVVDNQGKGTRTLFLGNSPHSAMFLNGSVKSVYRYTDLFNLAFGYNPNISRVLFIGGGGFSGPKQFLAYYPWISIDVVEIDPVVVEVAYDYFDVPRSHKRLNIVVEDGRRFLENAGDYDLIVLDAYSYTYVPFHLMTLEFTSLVVDHLNPGGVLVSNLIGSTVGDTSRLLWCEVLTVRENIPNVALYKTRNLPDSVVQNIVLVASMEELSPKNVVLNLEKIGADSRYFGFLNDRHLNEIPGNGFILRDNYAPVEDLLNPVTLTSYDQAGGLNPRNLLNPLFIAGLWMVSLGGLYTLTKKFGK